MAPRLAECAGLAPGNMVGPLPCNPVLPQGKQGREASQLRPPGKRSGGIQDWKMGASEMAQRVEVPSAGLTA